MIGVWLGIRGAWNRGGKFDNVSTGASLTLYSMPEWWLGLLLIAVFAVGFGPDPRALPDRRPALRRRRPGHVSRACSTRCGTCSLPVITLTLAYLADYALIMRSSLLDELGEDYLTTARAKGLRDVQVRNRHAVRNALLPTTTIVALNLGFVVPGRSPSRRSSRSRASGCWRPRPCRCPTTGCSRAPSWSPPPA